MGVGGEGPGGAHLRWAALVVILGVCSCDGCIPEFEGCSLDSDALGGGGTEGVGGSGGEPAPCELCGGECCINDEVCIDDACVVVGAACSDPEGCGTGWVCDFTGGDAVVAHPLGSFPACPEPLVGLCKPAPPADANCLMVSDQAGQAGQADLQLSVSGAWGDAAVPDAADSVVTSPVVLGLDDDNCDGVVDGFDRPEIIFMTASDGGGGTHGTLQVHQVGDEGLDEVWSSTPGTPPNDPTTHAAAARMQDEVIIAVCTADERVRAYDGAGAERWLGPASAACDSIAIVDIDGDGVLEVVTESQILDGVTGEEVATYGPAPSHGFVVGPMMGGPPRIVTATRVYDSEGTVLADAGLPEGFVALMGQVVVAVDPALGQLHLWRAYEDHAVVDATIDLGAPFSGSCPVGTLSGGPPAVIGFPSAAVIGLMTALGPILLDEGGEVSWAADDVACGEGTRPVTLHDLDGDREPEILAHRDGRLRIYGSDGAVLAEPCAAVEDVPVLPIVADLDADGFGEVVSVASARFGALCDGSPQAGVLVRELATPVTRTRAIHNQFAYRAAMVGDDGGPPVGYSEERGTRANSSDVLAPRLILETLGLCNVNDLDVRVVNTGAVPVAARQAAVWFREPLSGFMAEAVIPVTLEPSAGVDVVLFDPPSGEVHVTVVGRDGLPLGLCDGAVTSRTAVCP